MWTMQVRTECGNYLPAIADPVWIVDANGRIHKFKSRGKRRSVLRTHVMRAIANSSALDRTYHEEHVVEPRTNGSTETTRRTSQLP